MAFDASHSLAQRSHGTSKPVSMWSSQGQSTAEKAGTSGTQLAGQSAWPTTLPQGQIVTLQGGPLTLHVYHPRKEIKGVLVAVHGISRRAKEQIRAYRRVGKALGLVVVAPLFPKAIYPDYQRLGRSGRGQRADLALIRSLNALQDCYGIPHTPIVLTGYSGGAQFALRFALAHSQHVRALVVGAAGTYTLPTHRFSYPIGLHLHPNVLPGVTLNGSALLKLPTLVLVGAGDVTNDSAVNQHRVVRRVQGRHRLERAERWIETINALAVAHDLPPPATLLVLPGAGHSFPECVESGLVQAVRAYLAGFNPLPRISTGPRTETRTKANEAEA